MWLRAENWDHLKTILLPSNIIRLYDYMSSDNNEEEETKKKQKDSLSLLTQQSKGQSHFPPKKKH